TPFLLCGGVGGAASESRASRGNRRWSSPSRCRRLRTAGRRRESPRSSGPRCALPFVSYTSLRFPPILVPAIRVAARPCFGSEQRQLRSRPEPELSEHLRELG